MADQTRHTFDVEAETDDPLALVRSQLNQLDLNGSITRVRVELEAAEPIVLASDASDGQLESEEQAEPSRDDGGAGGPQTVECEHCGKVLDVSPGSAPEAVLRGHLLHCDETSGDDESSRNTPMLKEDSDRLAVAKVLYAHRDEGMLDLDQIRQYTPADAGVKNERFSSILWHLDDRGLVEKKPGQHDGEQMQYRLTDKGAEAVEEVAPVTA